MIAIHTLTSEAALRHFKTTERGLRASEAGERLLQSGRNQLPEPPRYSRPRLLIRQFANPLIYILLVAVGISFLLGHRADALFILIVILINAILGFFQEDKAERTLLFLKQAVRLRARVIRDGQEQEITATKLVPGDILVLQAGDKVPADARIITVQGLQVNESALTGESLSVEKSIEQVAPMAPLAERRNMVFTGTLVERGKATAVVTATGVNTEFGKIAASVQQTAEPVTPLQAKLSRFARLMSVSMLVIIGLVILIGYFTEQSFTDVFVSSLALAVSAIPAGLPPMITVILVLGMRRLLKHKALVKKLNVVETLGSATVICTDKTGTLTYGDMEVAHVLVPNREFPKGENYLSEILTSEQSEQATLPLTIAILSSDAFVENPQDTPEAWVIRGRPTEKALLKAGIGMGLRQDVLEEKHPMLVDIQFDSTIKLSGSVRQAGQADQSVVYVLGGGDSLLDHVEHIDIDGQPKALKKSDLVLLHQEVERLAARGLRVMACAYRSIPTTDATAQTIPELTQQLTLVGFIALKDPVRRDAKAALRLTRDAGIRTVIITGDHKATAVAVAAEIGMTLKEVQTIEGKDLDKVSDEQLQEIVKTASLYARVSPEHKTRIVQALRANQEVVAVIGDGVNDAPALKSADIGVAVGSGTEIAKETADMVLTDGNFHTLVKAVEQGRIVYENIRKTIIFLLADDFSEVFVFLGTVMFGMPLPLLPAQILWIDLIEDGFPATALAFGQEKQGIMNMPPRGAREPLFNRQYKKWLLSIFLIGGTALLSTYYFLLNSTGDIELTRTVLFALTAVDSLIFALIVSSLRRPILRRDLFANRYLILGMIVGAGMIAAAIYLPLLQGVLATVALAPSWWIFIAAVGLVELILLEATKYFFLRGASSASKAAA